MSVIVTGMDMPADGTKYRVVEDPAGRKFLVEDDRLFERCFLLRPLPDKHGRLIDGDALMKAFAPRRFTSVMGDAMRILDNWQTIVEAEGE